MPGALGQTCVSKQEARPAQAHEMEKDVRNGADRGEHSQEGAVCLLGAQMASTNGQVRL